MRLDFIAPLRQWQARHRRLLPTLHPGPAPVVWLLLGGFLTYQAERRRWRQRSGALRYHHRRRCHLCGRDFEGTATAQVCEAVWCLLVYTLRRRAVHRRGTRPGTCKGCRGTFTTRRTTARYCRPACKQRAYRRRVTLTLTSVQGMTIGDDQI